MLETPTEDLVDHGSTASMVRGPNAFTTKERSAEGNEGNGGKFQGGAEGPRGCTKENVRHPGRKYTAGLRRRQAGREWRGRGEEGAEEDTPRRKVQRQVKGEEAQLIFDVMFVPRLLRVLFREALDTTFPFPMPLSLILLSHSSGRKFTTSAKNPVAEGRYIVLFTTLF